MATNPQSGNPKPFGKVTVTAGGTPVRATFNQVDPTARVGLQTLLFQALSGNTGLTYVRMRGTGASPLGDDRTNLLFTLLVIPAPVSATQGPMPVYEISSPPQGAPFNLADIYIDAGVNGNGVLVSGIAG